MAVKDGLGTGAKHCSILSLYFLVDRLSQGKDRHIGDFLDDLSIYYKSFGVDWQEGEFSMPPKSCSPPHLLS